MLHAARVHIISCRRQFRDQRRRRQLWHESILLLWKTTTVDAYAVDNKFSRCLQALYGLHRIGLSLRRVNQSRRSAAAEGPRDALVRIEKSLQSTNDLDIYPRSL